MSKKINEFSQYANLWDIVNRNPLFVILNALSAIYFERGEGKIGAFLLGMSYKEEVQNEQREGGADEA